MTKEMMICQSSNECTDYNCERRFFHICDEIHKDKPYSFVCQSAMQIVTCIPVEPKSLADKLMSVVKKSSKQAKALETEPKADLQPKTVYCVGDGTCDKCIDGKCIISNQPCCDQSYENPAESDIRRVAEKICTNPEVKDLGDCRDGWHGKCEDCPDYKAEQVSQVLLSSGLTVRQEFDFAIPLVDLIYSREELLDRLMHIVEANNQCVQKAFTKKCIGAIEMHKRELLDPKFKEAVTEFNIALCVAMETIETMAGKR